MEYVWNASLVPPMGIGSLKDSTRPNVVNCVRPSVCYHVFCHYAQQGGQNAIPTGSVPHWVDFQKGDFRKSTAFKSYGVKTKRTSQYANEHGSDSARFEHGGGSRSNTKGEYVVLVCQKHPTDIARVSHYLSATIKKRPL